VPVGEWFRGPLRELLQESLLSDRSLARSYFRPDEVRRLVSQHLDRRSDHPEGSAVLDGRERASVAVGQDVRGLGDQRGAVAAHLAVDRHVLVG